MSEVSFSFTPRRHISGSSTIHIDDDELPPVGKQLLAGAANHLANVISTAWEWFEIVPGDFDALTALNKATLSRIDSDEILQPLDSQTYSEADGLIGDFLAMSCVFAKIALDKLCSGDYSEFVSSLSRSISFYEIYSTHLTYLKEGADTGNDHHVLKEAHAVHCRNASEKAAAPHRAVKEKALKIYREGNFKSKNNAAEIISKQVSRSYAVVRGWLQGVQSPR